MIMVDQTKKAAPLAELYPAVPERQRPDMPTAAQLNADSREAAEREKAWKSEPQPVYIAPKYRKDAHGKDVPIVVEGDIPDFSDSDTRKLPGAREAAIRAIRAQIAERDAADERDPLISQDVKRGRGSPPVMAGIHLMIAQHYWYLKFSPVAADRRHVPINVGRHWDMSAIGVRKIAERQKANAQAWVVEWKRNEAHTRNAVLTMFEAAAMEFRKLG
jgi:hypothetical protein